MTTRRLCTQGLRWLASVTVLCVLSACAQQAPQATTPLAVRESPTPVQLLAASVTGVFAQAVLLQEGRYAGPPFADGAASRATLQLWAPSAVSGDFDGVAGDEAAAMLSANTGGSGEFVYLAAFATEGNQARTISTVSVGDRVRLIRLWGESGKIIMDVVEASPDDPACCATQVARKVFSWHDGGLKLTSSNVMGSLSIELLAATDWLLVAMDGQALPDSELPPTAAIQYGRIAGFAGCNRYTVPVDEADPGKISLGAIVAVTSKACPDPATQLERQFLDRLAKIDHYQFESGQLLLRGPASSDRQPSLLFVR